MIRLDTAMGHLWALVATLLASIATAPAAVGQDDAPITLPEPRREDASPRRIALVIGVGEYAHPNIPDLDYARSDAQRMVGLLLDPALGGFDPTATTLLATAKDTSRSEILNAINALDTSPLDTVLVYISGHGRIAWSDAHGEPRIYLYASDTDPGDRLVEETALDLFDVVRALERLEARGKMLILDGCMTPRRGDEDLLLAAAVTSGAEGGREPPELPQGLRLQWEHLLTQMGTSAAVVMAATLGQPSWELHDLGGGLYSRFFMDGIEAGLPADGDRGAGSAAPILGDGAVFIEEAHNYARDCMCGYLIEKGLQYARLEGATWLEEAGYTRSGADLGTCADPAALRRVLSQAPSGEPFWADTGGPLRRWCDTDTLSAFHPDLAIRLVGYADLLLAGAPPVDASRVARVVNFGGLQSRFELRVRKGRGEAAAKGDGGPPAPEGQRHRAPPTAVMTEADGDLLIADTGSRWTRLETQGIGQREAGWFDFAPGSAYSVERIADELRGPRAIAYAAASGGPLYHLGNAGEVSGLGARIGGGLGPRWQEGRLRGVSLALTAGYQTVGSKEALNRDEEKNPIRSIGAWDVGARVAVARPLPFLPPSVEIGVGWQQSVLIDADLRYPDLSLFAFTTGGPSLLMLTRLNGTLDLLTQLDLPLFFTDLECEGERPSAPCLDPPPRPSLALALLTLGLEWRVR